MPFGCRLCIARYGLRGDQVKDLPQTEDEFFEHLRAVHGITVTEAGNVEGLGSVNEVGLDTPPDAA